MNETCKHCGEAVYQDQRGDWYHEQDGNKHCFRPTVAEPVER